MICNKPFLLTQLFTLHCPNSAILLEVWRYAVHLAAKGAELWMKLTVVHKARA